MNDKLVTPEEIEAWKMSDGTLVNKYDAIRLMDTVLLQIQQAEELYKRAFNCPYVPSWAYDPPGPKVCTCGHHEGYHTDDGVCNQAKYCSCPGFGVPLRTFCQNLSSIGRVRRLVI